MSAEGHHESRNTLWKTPWLNTSSMLIPPFMMGPLLVIFWIYEVRILNYKLEVSAVVVRKQPCICSKFGDLLNSLKVFLRSDVKNCIIWIILICTPHQIRCTSRKYELIVRVSHSVPVQIVHLLYVKGSMCVAYHGVLIFLPHLL
jgi:hypothetical protein